MRGFVKWGSLALLAALAVIAVLSGADNRGIDNNSIDNNSNVQRARFVQPLPGAGVSDRTGNNPQPKTTVQTARDVAEGVPGVRRAWPVQSGNDMLVGIELDMDAKGDASEIERQVAQRIGAKAPAVDNLRVTSQPGQVSRLRTIYQSATLGQPMGSFAGDFAELWRNVPVGTMQ